MQQAALSAWLWKEPFQKVLGRSHDFWENCETDWKGFGQSEPCDPGKKTVRSREMCQIQGYFVIIGIAYSLVVAGFGLSVLLTKLHGLDIQAMESAGAAWSKRQACCVEGLRISLSAKMQLKPQAELL